MRAISGENRKYYLSTVLAQLDLLSAVWREVEHEDGEEADAHAGDDEVDGVEESLPPHGDVEGDVQVRFLTAGVELDIPHCGHLQQQFGICCVQHIDWLLKSFKLHSYHKAVSFKTLNKYSSLKSVVLHLKVPIHSTVMSFGICLSYMRPNFSLNF